MTTEIQKAKQPIVMKSGLVHWVTKETAERARFQLANQTAHSFMEIKELKIAINTAEIEGIYGVDEYDALVKAKQGMYQCVYHKWHEKNGKCDCQAEIFRKQKALKQMRAEEAANKPLTDQERKRAKKAFDETTKWLKDRGILK